jgi:hypothetical protein
LSTLANQFALLHTSATNFSIVLPSQKRIYENNGGMMISSMAYVVATPQSGDFGSRADVVNVIGKILTAYNTYITDLDSLQTDNGGDTDSYIPDGDSLSALTDLISYTISNLFKIALNSKQERTIILEADSNVILLAHRFYGIDESDSSIDQFIRNNNIGINEMLEVKKGRKIVYYV